MTMTPAPETTGAATGNVRTTLRLEGLVLFTVMTALYAVWGGSWWVYAVVFFVPDISMLGYLSSPRFGAIVYNVAHSYMLPSALMGLAFAMSAPLMLSLAMIWLAHIGFDRALGYGLKYERGFRHTHLGRIGKADPAPAP